MKKFIVSMLSVAVFFIGLGSLVDKVGAKFKSDEKALALIAQARQAIGGDAAIKNVQSFSATGKVTKNFEIEGVQRTEQGDLELNLQLPNKFGKMVKLGVQETGEKNQTFDRKVVIVEKSDKEISNKQVLNDDGSKKDVIIVRKGDGDKTFERIPSPNGEIDKIVIDDKVRASFDKIHQNDLFRATFSLLLSAPQGVEAEYVYAGEGSVDGNSCDIIEARNDSSSVRLYLDKSSHLPRMMSFTDAKPMMMFFKHKKDDASVEETGDVKTFNRKIEAPAMEEFQIKFSDYRSVGGLQLPHLWTQTVGGRADETIEITGYEINPANIADKFNKMPQEIRIRTGNKQ